MKVVEWMIRALLGIPVVFGVFLLIMPLIGISVDIVLSGSMEPAFQAGGLVFTDTRKQEIETGDIVTYSVEKMTVTHRVVQKNKNGYVTKGDANEIVDAGIVKESQILGKVVFYIPYAGYVISFLKRKAVFCLLLAALVWDILKSGLNWKGERMNEMRGNRI